mgnify:CR=1 FL=1
MKEKKFEICLDFLFFSLKFLVIDLNKNIMKTLDKVSTNNLFYRPLSVTPLHSIHNYRRYLSSESPFKPTREWQLLPKNVQLCRDLQYQYLYWLLDLKTIFSSCSKTKKYWHIFRVHTDDKKKKLFWWRCPLILDDRVRIKLQAQIQYYSSSQIQSALVDFFPCISLLSAAAFSRNFKSWSLLPSLFCIVALFSAARKFSAEFNGLSWLSAQKISVVHTTFCIILCQMQNRNKSLFAHQLLFERRREGRGVGGNYYANRLDQGYIGNYSTNTFGSTFMWKIGGN